MSSNDLLDPIPPGEILREDFMEPMGISINQLSRDLAVPPNRISEIVNGKRGLTADTALRLERYFGVEAQFWLNLQSEYDLRVMKRKVGRDIELRIISVKKFASQLGPMGAYPFACSRTPRHDGSEKHNQRGQCHVSCDVAVAEVPRVLDG
jgi:addiction module HigA family antidote